MTAIQCDRARMRTIFGRVFVSSAAAVALLLGCTLLHGPGTREAEAKTPGSTYCFLGVCHRVKTIAETRAQIGRTETLVASYYDSAGIDRFNPSNMTSSGEYFAAGRADNAASPIYPNGTKLLVWHPGTKQALIVRVNNAGPYWGRRLLDLSRGAAERLGMTRTGTATVQVRVLEAPTPGEATYVRNRRYAPVPGPIGSYPSLDQAHAKAALALALPRTPTAGATVAAAGPSTDDLERSALIEAAPVVIATAVPELPSDDLAQADPIVIADARAMAEPAMPAVGAMPVTASAEPGAERGASAAVSAVDATAGTGAVAPLPAAPAATPQPARVAAAKPARTRQASAADVVRPAAIARAGKPSPAPRDIAVKRGKGSAPAVQVAAKPVRGGVPARPAMAQPAADDGDEQEKAASRQVVKAQAVRRAVAPNRGDDDDDASASRRPAATYAGSDPNAGQNWVRVTLNQY